jgi:hypothetical protein
MFNHRITRVTIGVSKDEECVVIADNVKHLGYVVLVLVRISEQDRHSRECSWSVCLANNMTLIIVIDIVWRVRAAMGRFLLLTPLLTLCLHDGLSSEPTEVREPLFYATND